MFTIILFIARKLFPEYADRIRSAKRIIKAVELAVLLFAVGVVGSMIIWLSGHHGAAWAVLLIGIAGSMFFSYRSYMSGRQLARNISNDVRGGLSRVQNTPVWHGDDLPSLASRYGRPSSRNPFLDLLDDDLPGGKRYEP